MCNFFGSPIAVRLVEFSQLEMVVFLFFWKTHTWSPKNDQVTKFDQVDQERPRAKKGLF
jgi:hypothetical protein